MIEPGHDLIPQGRQCELVGLPRASLYYRPRPITALEERLMRLIDEVYTRWPFYGVRRITAWLRRQWPGVQICSFPLTALYPPCH